MSFRSNPMSEEAAEKARQFPMLEPGEYYFKVFKAEFEHSQKGNPQIKLELLVTHEGKDYRIFDYLVAMENMEWKTRHFCKATGLLKQYESDEFNEHLCPGAHGWVSINKQLGRQKPDGSWYKDKNNVEDYVVKSEKSDSFGSTARAQVANYPINNKKSDSQGHADLPFDDVPF